MLSLIYCGFNIFLIFPNNLINTHLTCDNIILVEEDLILLNYFVELFSCDFFLQKMVWISIILQNNMLRRW